ncbi:MAG: YlbF family regulator [Clostridia bacterium]|nr:YlbF family regulator [Clostridia bacterium]
MDVIKAARELGKAIQADERYLKLGEARKLNDEDAELQKLIGEFNLKRMTINQASASEEVDQEKMAKLNEELMALYNTIMDNENMKAYDAAKEEFDSVIHFVETIISGSLEGEDPDEITEHSGGCSGSCSTCGGCH